MAVALRVQEELSGEDWLHMGHDEPLLRLVPGSRVFLTKAQTDLVLRLRATILQVGPQFLEEAACIQQLAGVLALQFVGL